MQIKMFWRLPPKLSKARRTESTTHNISINGKSCGSKRRQNHEAFQQTGDGHEVFLHKDDKSSKGIDAQSENAISMRHTMLQSRQAASEHR
jgi:hypothetical protein